MRKRLLGSVAALALASAQVSPSYAGLPSPAIQTPPANDNSPLAANTSFVQTLIGSLKNYLLGLHLAHASNAAALAASTGYAFPVVRDDVHAEYTHATSACTLGSNGAGDNGAQIQDAAGTGCWNLVPTRDLDQYIYGIDCTGATDSTTKVQAMWTAAVALQRPIDHKSCIAQTTSTITILGHIITKGFRPAMTPQNTIGADPQTMGPGAWYYLNHTGVGFNIYDAQGANGGANGAGTGLDDELKGFGLSRNQPVPSTTANTAYTPCSCSYDIALHDSQARLDLSFLNPTKALLLDSAGKTSGDLYGQPLGIGVDHLASYDDTYFGVIHWWTYWSNNANVLAYMGTNALGLHTGRADGMHVRDLFCFAMLKCLDVDNFAGNGGGEPSGTAYLVTLDRIYADSTTFGIFVEPTAVNSTINVGELVSQPNTTYSRADAEAINIQGTGTKLNISGRVACDYENLRCIDNTGGTGNTVTVGNVLLGSFSRAVTGANVVPAFQGTALNPIEIGTMSTSSDVGNGNGTTYFGTNAFLTSLWAGNPATAPLTDSSQATVGLTSCTGAASCASGTQLQLPTGRGELIVTDNQDSTFCHFILSGGGVTLLGQNSGAPNCAVARTNGKLDVSFQSGAYVLTNDLGLSGTTTFYVAFTRLTPFN